eukprot:CAMPEP_0196654322 /NCGR_PEP_ID=MMETSP1086-20130531/4024_1 /TAXON_ID=77921 /ORGANISM="Cyanoptyche  gloeocystis , Strain SAG4.97" /LENGTH=70 /DNA_ID=CAMNT_0041986009 /DNA_START=878 /DNA_END=1087 /DNA_ORIENTATION=+
MSSAEDTADGWKRLVQNKRAEILGFSAKAPVPDTQRRGPAADRKALIKTDISESRAKRAPEWGEMSESFF